MPEINLKLRIFEDMKAAMKAHDARRLGVIRLLMAAIKQREIDERVLLDDTQILAVLDKMLKQRQDSSSQFKQAARLDLVEQEEFEITILQAYLPAPFDTTEIDALIQQAIDTLKANSIKDMGAVMAQLKPILQGRADIGLVSAKVKEKLSAH